MFQQQGDDFELLSHSTGSTSGPRGLNREMEGCRTAPSQSDIDPRSSFEKAFNRCRASRAHCTVKCSYSTTISMLQICLVPSQ